MQDKEWCMLKTLCGKLGIKTLGQLKEFKDSHGCYTTKQMIAVMKEEVKKK